MAVTFQTLKEEATIFSELAKGPTWWNKVKSDQSLYIEIRKDNQVNVYFEGGSVARIHYCSKHKRLQVFTHHKYLGIVEEKPMYIECSAFIDNQLDKILNRIKQEYSQKQKSGKTYLKEQWSEKYIQGNIILNDSDEHLDSELAYKDDDTDIRIDLVRVVDGAITFVELKRLDDARMLKRDEKEPEVIRQMNEYQKFIEKYKEDILHYYQLIFRIKQRLGLPVPNAYPLTVNSVPELLIFNRWEKKHPARDRHKANMEAVLNKHHINYKIIDNL